MQLLLTFLAAPARKAWQDFAVATGVAALLPPRPGVERALVQGKIDALCAAEEMPDLTIPPQAPAGGTLYGIVQRLNLALIVHLEQSAFAAKAFDDLGVWLRLDDCAERRRGDTFKAAWRVFFQLHNLLQFAPGFHPLTSEQVKTHTVRPAMPGAPPAPPVVEPGALAADWAAALEFADERCRPLLDRCLAANIAAPIVGYELTEAGRVTGMCELAWPAAAVAVLLDDPGGAESLAFTQTGWKAFELGMVEIDDVVAEVVRRMGLGS